MSLSELWNPTLEVHLEPHDKQRVFIICKGESDIYTVHNLVKAIKTSLNDGFSHLTVDLSKVNYLDANTLTVLVSGYKQCDDRHGTLDVITNGGRVRRIFEIVGLDNHFAIHASREIALSARAFAPSPA